MTLGESNARPGLNLPLDPSLNQQSIVNNSVFARHLGWDRILLIARK